MGIDWNSLTVSDADTSKLPTPGKTRENPLVKPVADAYADGRWKELPPQSNAPGEIRRDKDGQPRLDKQGNPKRKPSEVDTVENMLRNAAAENNVGVKIRRRKDESDPSREIIVFLVKDKTERKRKNDTGEKSQTPSESTTTVTSENSAKPATNSGNTKPSGQVTGTPAKHPGKK